jgi:hypothetical protein
MHPTRFFGLSLCWLHFSSAFMPDSDEEKLSENMVSFDTSTSDGGLLGFSTGSFAGFGSASGSAFAAASFLAGA